jgi:hypothetical protein
MWTGRCDKAKSLFTILHTCLKTGRVLTAIEFQGVVCPYLRHRKDIWCQFHTLKKLLMIHIEQLMNRKHTVPGSISAGVVLHVGKSKMCAQHFD